MGASNPTVFVVDDDDAIRKSMTILARTVGLNVQAFENAQSFLDVYDPGMPGCLVLDVRMPGINGLELRRKLVDDGYCIPTIIVTGHGDIAMAVEAVHSGAVDFIEKPFRDQAVLDSINRALALDARIRREQIEHAHIQEKLATLTRREREILDMVVQGYTNKSVAYELKISPKTADFHRLNVLDKMGVESPVELVLLMQRLLAA